MSNKFLGKGYDPMTDTWRYHDGSGVTITSEQKEDAIKGRDYIPVLDITHLFNNAVQTREEGEDDLSG